MTINEFKNLKIDDTVWICILRLTKTGRIEKGLLISTKLKDIGDTLIRFEIVSIRTSSSLYTSTYKEKDNILLNRSDTLANSFLSESEAIDTWNSIIQNKKDELTFKYEKSIKKLDKKLMKYEDRS